MIERRRLLAWAAAVPAAVAAEAGSAGACGSQHAPTADTFVLVHGAWHNSFCWCEVADGLRSAGHRVLAIDLPGHGIHARYPTSYFTAGQAGFATEASRVAAVTLDVAACAVVTALKSVGDGPRKPILVGHSLGGTVITRAAELAPEAIGRLVYLSAFLPTRVTSPAALYQLLPQTPNRLAVGEPDKLGAVRYNPRGDSSYLRELHAVFYQDVDFERFLPFAALLSPDLPLPLWVTENPVTAERWGRLPRTYIHCTEDRAISLALQRRMVADADLVTPRNPTRVHSLASSHSPFVACVAQLTALLGQQAYWSNRGAGT